MKDIDCYTVDEVDGEADPLVERAAGERIRWVDNQHDPSTSSSYVRCYHPVIIITTIAY
jgi:hypothetical protein